MIIFYLNYAWLIDRYFFNRRDGFKTRSLLRFVAVNLLCMVLLILSEQITRPSLSPLENGERRMEKGERTVPRSPVPPVPRSPVPPVIRSPFSVSRAPFPFPRAPFFANIILLSLVASAALAIKATTRWYNAQAAMATLEKEKSVAELQQLRSQLNPHFLFNSLNNIYALIDFDPAHAQQAVHTLGEMLRHQLYEATQEKIPLHKEVDFIRNYCHLMQLRLPKNVTLSLDFPDDDCEIAIAPLLFAPLVENAFKHGVSPSQPSHIAVAISILDERSPVCTVRNSFFPKSSDDRSGSGIGLDNLRKRLDLLYPGKYQWKVGRMGEEFIAEIILHPDND
jgi:hypothetical protein